MLSDDAPPAPLRRVSTMADVLRDAAAIAKLPPPPAPTCRACGQELTRENTAGAKRAGMCAACEVDEVRARRRANAPRLLADAEEFAWASFDAPELARRVKPVEAIAKARAAILAPLVMFRGEGAAGKTSLACAALRARYVETGDVPYFVSASSLAIARARHKLGEGDPEEVKRALNADILLIDDLGFESPPPSAVRDVDLVIDYRHRRARPLWVTTSLEFGKIRERYGENVARRLQEDGRAVIIRCGKGAPKP